MGGTALRFNPIAAALEPSPIRELFKVISQPGMISFAGGLPAPDAFPVEAFADCADVLRTDGRTLLQYGASEGYGPLREILLERMSAFLEFDVAPEQLLVTSGAQQVVDLMARALLEPGDVVVVEAPTYPGTLHTLRMAGARFAAVPCDGDGMVVEALPDVVDRVIAETGRRPKLVYTVPDFSNPTGATLAADRRARLVELADDLELPVLEDDPYGRLRYAGEPLPPLARLAGAGSHVVYASSFSKVLAPGVRVAWVVGPPELIRTMTLLRQGVDLCTSTVTQALVAEYCRRGHLDRHLGHILEVYATRRDAMLDAMDRHLDRSTVEWRPPDGGFFVWARFPDREADAVFERAVAEGVAFVPGGAFYPAPAEQVGQPVTGPDRARLCFTFADARAIDEGCRRLARALG
jgi:2-aminoadipate transaminase